MNVTHRVALVTGAGGGIGRGIALALARRGCHLALADLDPVGLAQTAALGVRVSTHGSGVGVLVVYPGGVATGIVRNARAAASLSPAQAEKQRAAQQKLLRLSPAKAGELIVQGIERDRARLVIGTSARLAALLERLLPVSHWQVIQTVFRR